MGFRWGFSFFYLLFVAVVVVVCCSILKYFQNCFVTAANKIEEMIDEANAKTDQLKRKFLHKMNENNVSVCACIYIYSSSSSSSSSSDGSKGGGCGRGNLNK